ncbi:MAG: nucleoside phosphorylase [Pseudomonadales bacterium]
MVEDVFLPILKAQASEIPDRILVVGDPDRIDVVARSLTGVESISHNREYRSVRGRFNDQEIGVVSHGVGSAGAGACFEELCLSGASRIIRAGSAGGMQPSVTAGDVVIATAAVREDGLSFKLVPPGYPAVVSADILIAMRVAADKTACNVHEGLLLTSDLFYPGNVLGSDLLLWQRAGVIAVEMECATLFIICGLHGIQTGAVVAIDGNPLNQDEGSMESYDPHRSIVTDAVDHSLKIALQALVS